MLFRSSLRDQDLSRKCRVALCKLADELIEGAEETTYYTFRTKGRPVNRLVLPKRTIVPVVAAHFLTHDRKYTDALCRTVQYTMGANPMNRGYVSGLGERWFIPYQLDFDVADMPAPSGLPNFGPIYQTATRWGWAGIWAIRRIENGGLYPDKLLDWPFAEKCFNNCWVAPVNEFTVRHPMGELITLAGYLAQNASRE